ncbi:tetratricopeptide repeat protein [Taibaiella lutea]|nr:tetratricopeptide repeat protein [Taibaiella lutea]
MLKIIAPFFILGMILVSCGSSQPEETNPAYHNPTVQPLTDSIRENPNDAALYFRRAEALSQINNDSLALVDVIKAQSLDKNNQQYSFTIGYLNLQLGHTDAAIKALQENLKVSSGNVNTRILLAKAFLADNKVEDAKHQVNQILAAAPQHAGAMLMQAEIFAAQKDTASAINTLLAVLKTDPLNYQASYGLATLYSESDNDMAVPQYQQTFRLDTMDVTPLYDLASFYADRKDIPKAKEFYTDCILRDRDYTDAYIALGKIFYQEKNTEKALRHFNMAIESQPNDAEAYFYKGQCFETMHQKDSAVVAYNQSLVFNPNLKDAMDGLRRLK